MVVWLRQTKHRRRLGVNTVSLAELRFSLRGLTALSCAGKRTVSRTTVTQSIAAAPAG